MQWVKNEWQEIEIQWMPLYPIAILLSNMNQTIRCDSEMEKTESFSSNMNKTVQFDSVIRSRY